MQSSWSACMPVWALMLSAGGPIGVCSRIAILSMVLVGLCENQCRNYNSDSELGGVREFHLSG